METKTGKKKIKGKKRAPKNLALFFKNIKKGVLKNNKRASRKNHQNPPFKKESGNPTNHHEGREPKKNPLKKHT